MTAADFTIAVKHASPGEERTRDQLLALLDRYDVSRWVRTRRVVIEDGVIPHSHPVLTLDTRDLADEYVMSAFLHEQVHWLLSTNYFRTVFRMRRAKNDLRRRYPDIHRPLPAGAANEDSSYLHLIVNCLERRAVLEEMGAQAIERLTPFWLTDHYTAIYDVVLRDHEEIDALIDSQRLGPS
jgi:hypothetical protein